MVGRVTHGILTANFLRNLNAIASRLEHAQEQLATGRKLLRASDGPIEVARILQYQLSLSQIMQFKLNIEDGISQVEKAGTTILDVETALQDARDHAVDGASDNLNRFDRYAIADSVNQILEGTLQSANDNFKGRYIFAGYHTQSRPFWEDVNPRSQFIDNIRYDGTLGKISRRVGRFSATPVNFDGYEAYMNRTHTYEGVVLPPDEPLGFQGTLTINNRDFLINTTHTLTNIRNMINADREAEVFAEVRVNQLILRSTNSSEEVIMYDSEDGDLLQNLGLAQIGARTIGTSPPLALPVVDSTPAIFTGFGPVANLTYDSTNNRLNIRIGPDADPGGGGQAHNIVIPEGTYATVADLAAAIQTEVNNAFGKDVLIVSEAGGVLSFTTVATGDAITAGNLMIGGPMNGLDDNASDFNDLNLINADPAPGTFAQTPGVDGNDKLIIDIGELISHSGFDVPPQTIDLRAAQTTTFDELIEEINYQIYQNSYLRGVVKADDYNGRVRIFTLETGEDIDASQLVITEGATGTLANLNFETTATPAFIDGAVIGAFPLVITNGVNDEITFDLGPTVSADGINPDPRTITLIPGNYANMTAIIDQINLQIRRYDDLYGSVQAVSGGVAPNEYIRIESVATGSRVRGTDLNLSGTALATLNLAAGDAVNGGGTSGGAGVHLDPQNIFDTLIDLRDDLMGYADGDTKLVDAVNDDQDFLGILDGDIITISTSLKSFDMEVLVFHTLEDLVYTLNEFFGTQGQVRMTNDGRLEFENLETSQIANLSITAASTGGDPRTAFNELFKNFPTNIPGGSKVVSEQITDPKRYLKVGELEIGRIDIELEKLLGIEAQVGARSNRMRSTRNMFEDNQLNITRLKTDIEDANIAEVFTRLTQMEMVLESTLNVGARVLTPSLINFLR